jgi:hypothetical protein
LNDIQKTHYSKNKVAVTFDQFLSTSTEKLNNEGKTVFGLAEDDLVDLLKDQAAKKGLKRDIKNNFKSLIEEIDTIKNNTNNTTTSITTFNALNVAGSTKANIDEFVAKCSNSKISDLLRGDSFKKNDLGDIACRTEQSDEIVKILAQEQAKLSKKISELPSDVSLVSSDANNPKVNVKAALVSLNNGIHDWAAGLSKLLLSTADVDQATLLKLVRAAKRSHAVGKFLGTMKINPGNTDAGKTLLSRACDPSKGGAADLTTLQNMLGTNTSGATSYEHSRALADYLCAITGETAANLNAPANNVLYYGHNNTAATATGSRVILTELASAFGVTAPSATNFDGNGVKPTAAEIADIVKVFQPLTTLRGALSNTTLRKLPTENAYAIIKSNSEGQDGGLVLSTPSWNLHDKNTTSISEIAPYFEGVTKRITDLKKTSADAFKAVSGDWAKTLTETYNGVDSFIQSRSAGLMGSAAAGSSAGVLEGMNLENITDARLKIKAAYDAAIAALDVKVVTNPTGAGSELTIATAKNIAELIALPNIKNKLNAEMIAEIKKNEAVSKQIKDITDSAKAKETYTTMLGSLAKGAEGKVLDADVAALKALFADSVQSALGAKEEIQLKRTEESRLKEGKEQADTQRMVEGQPQKQTGGTQGGDEDWEDTFDIKDIIDLKTGNLVKDGYIESMDEILKQQVNAIKKDNKKKNGTAEDLKSAIAETAKDTIDNLVKKFTEKYDEEFADEIEEDDDAAKKQADRAKKQAVKTATTVITARVNAAFGLTKPKQAKKIRANKAVKKGNRSPAKRGKGQARRGRSNSANAAKKGTKSPAKRTKSRSKSSARKNIGNNARNNARNNTAAKDSQGEE